MSNDVPLPWKIKWLENQVASKRVSLEVNRELARRGMTTAETVKVSEADLLTGEAILRDYDAKRIEAGLKRKDRANG